MNKDLILMGFSSIEEFEKAQQELRADPDWQRRRYISKVFHDGTATPEEIKEFEDNTWWLHVNSGRLMSDAAPQPWDMPRPEKKADVAPEEAS